MATSMPERSDDDQRANVPENPGTDRAPDPARWDFISVLTEDDLSEDARRRRAAYVDPDALRALDRGAGQ